VVCSGISDSTLQAFRNVGKHRNKMVHFFHEAHPASENPRLRTQIAKEQLNAWYLLNQLLTGPWKDVFGAWLPQISDIDTRLREHRKYLQVVFDHLEPEIRVLAQEGILFEVCPSCGFKAQKREGADEYISVADCLVCGVEQSSLHIECPFCGKPVEFVGEGFSDCFSCGKHLEPEHIVDALRDDDAEYSAARDGKRSWEVGNCSDCEVLHTVVRIAPDKYVCASCLGAFESLQPCEWCDELNTGDMEDSYVSGCSVCEGRLGYGD
jgi:hypothetical protein